MALKNRLLVQCIIDAKIKNLPGYYELLQAPDGYLRVMLESIATVMEKEINNFAKRINKKIKSHDHPHFE